MLANFHFLRPLWFLAFVPAIILFISFYKNKSNHEDIWQKHCDAHLINHLMVNSTSNRDNTTLATLIFVIWSFIIIALAGPTWSMYSDNVYQKNIARVIALDVSQSMNNNDISPSRLERAKYKTLDLLKNYKEGQTGMVVFSSEPFVVSPLSSDSKTIANMIPVINSTIVPVQGVDIGKSLQKSAKLIADAGFSNGQILLITDNEPTDSDNKIAKELSTAGYQINVLAIGNNKNITNEKYFEDLANAGNGHYMFFTKDNSDVEYFSNDSSLQDSAKSTSNSTTANNLWRDQGHWLIWFVIILALFIARKEKLGRLC
ncbi:MAG: VWA domain-containing protein [Burkholderiales bacterium]|nr:VWA domain-containing protein [Burkholderiales bacterium]